MHLRLLAATATQQQHESKLCAGGNAERQRTTLSTLVRPFGQSKVMPLVVHSSGNTVYEEPCVAYLHLNISKVTTAADSREPDAFCLSWGETMLYVPRLTIA